MSVKNYKCINCGSGIVFEPEKQLWVCDSCFSEFTKAELDSFYYNKDDLSGLKDKADREEKAVDVADEFSSYNCQNCGGEIVADDTIVATFCPYCKSSSIIKGKLKGEFAPEEIIPFHISLEKSKEIYKKYISNKIFTPKSFKTRKTIDEIRGIYAPFWLFDVEISGNLSGTGTKVTTWSDGNYRYTKTDYYRIKRGGRNLYKKVPVDSSIKMDDELMVSIEPYDYKEIKDFSMDYMSGFFAERFDVDSEKSRTVARKRASNFFESRLDSTISGYDSYKIDKKQFYYDDGRPINAMLPVYYIVNYDEGKKYDFMINGQTGKIYGNPPISKVRVGLYFIALFLLFSFIGITGGSIYDFFMF